MKDLKNKLEKNNIKYYEIEDFYNYGKILNDRIKLDNDIYIIVKGNNYILDTLGIMNYYYIKDKKYKCLNELIKDIKKLMNIYKELDNITKRVEKLGATKENYIE